MWDKILEVALSDGLWAVLFLLLLMYELKDSRKREEKYQKTISSLSENFSILKEVDKNVKKISGKLCSTNDNNVKNFKVITKKTSKKNTEETTENFKKEA